MNYLITGCAGFIGSNLIDKLLENKDIKLIGIDNLNNFYDKIIKEKNIENALKNKNFIFIKNDLLDIESLDNIFNNYDINSVIHLAGYGRVRPSIDNPKLYIDNNIIATFKYIGMYKKIRSKKDNIRFFK